MNFGCVYATFIRFCRIFVCLQRSYHYYYEETYVAADLSYEFSALKKSWTFLGLD